ncbi:hypothetical protein ELG77_09090 [Rhizobium leguminosarum]|uniref:hypothetical protein n=1 Tax=Rhizobium leguminosarum TaxID=384 RepID=UPI001032702A|nr:hypothetical protein [Rhizobium leguminosarum]TBG41915.1 hypothetical protein ELG77_09090 [Rhizobium leguminosarum]
MSYMTIIPPRRAPKPKKDRVHTYGGQTNPIDPRVPHGLVDVYSTFTPEYLYGGIFKPVNFERIRHWPETGEFVVVLCSEVYCTTTHVQWTERFVWVYRGRMVELKQFGVRSGWRQSRIR